MSQAMRESGVVRRLMSVYQTLASTEPAAVTVSTDTPVSADQVRFNKI